MNDKNLRKFLLGESSKFNPIKNQRTVTVEFPTNGIENTRSYTYMADDGFILHLIRTIEKLEKRVETLESKKK